MQPIKRHFALVLLMLAPLAACGEDPPPAQAVEVRPCTVSNVVDGDTLDCVPGERVRVRCLDTPERGDPGYDEATDDATRLLLGQDVRLTGPFRRDRWGRLIADVYLPDGREFGATMQAMGWAGYPDPLCPS